MDSFNMAVCDIVHDAEFARLHNPVQLPFPSRMPSGRGGEHHFATSTVSLMDAGTPKDTIWTGLVATANKLPQNFDFRVCFSGRKIGVDVKWARFKKTR